MKKRAFTLAETIITFGIIGVIAAILLPLVSKIKPDDTKVSYLKAYDALTTSVKYLTSKSSVYGVLATFENNNVTVSTSDYPLLSQAANIDVNYSGQNKFCKLIAESFGVTANDNNCSAASFQTSQYLDNLWKDSKNYFETQNGMKWIIRQEKNTPVSGTASPDGENYTVSNVINHVYVKVKDSDKDCLYNSTSCKQPNVFKFGVGADGKIAVLDKKGADYLKTRTSWLKKDGDGTIDTLESTLNLPVVSSKQKDCLSKGSDYKWINNSCQYKL